MEIFCSNSDYNEAVRSQFWTCHDTWPVMVYATLQPDFLSCMSNIFFLRFELWAQKTFAKRLLLCSSYTDKVYFMLDWDMDIWIYPIVYVNAISYPSLNSVSYYLFNDNRIWMRSWSSSYYLQTVAFILVYEETQCETWSVFATS